MKKNDVFTFTAPNGVEVTGVVLHRDNIEIRNIYLCYAQNRLFIGYTDNQWVDVNGHKERIETPFKVKEVIVDYAVLPDYDELMRLHSSMEYPQWKQNLEAEIQGMNDR